MNTRLVTVLRFSRLFNLLVALLANLCLVPFQGHAQSYTVLHSFGTNEMGLGPCAALVQGPDGVLYGTTGDGGTCNQGQVFKVKPDGTDYTVLKNCTVAEGANPNTRLVLAGGTLYGTTVNGGDKERGTIFRIQTDGSRYAVLKHFPGREGADPNVDLSFFDDELYGATERGGWANAGTLFRVNTDGSGYTVLHEFSAPSNPSGMIVRDRIIYGTTAYGGNWGAGTIFSLKTDGSGFSVIKDFACHDGACPSGALLLSGPTLYGTTFNGGQSESGVVYALNTDGSGFAVLKDFSEAKDGQYPNGGLVLSGSELFGTCGGSASTDFGTLFKVSTNGTGFSVLHGFTNRNYGFNPRAGLTLAGKTLYGTTYLGGAFSYGTAFKLQTDGTSYTNIVHFMGGDGTTPGAIVLSGLSFYGVTEGGGGSGSGTLFKVNTNGTGYTLLKNFTNSVDGANPYGPLLLNDSILYGTARSGGEAWNGTLFSLNTDGTGYTVLKDFTNSLDGANPSGGLLMVGTTLFGTAASGGRSNCGTVFKIGTDGRGFSVLKHFTGVDGELPCAGLIISGTTLYGTTVWGGSYDQGTVFAIEVNGTGFTVLRNFDGRDGAAPDRLLLDGSTLYGTSEGGGHGFGSMFRIRTDGTAFRSFDPFGWGTAVSPKGEMCLIDKTLYGGCNEGVFQINTDGTGFAMVKNLKAANSGPAYPYAGVTLSGQTLFGTAGYGGNLDGGMLFAVSLLPGVEVIPQPRTVEAGASVSFFFEVTGSHPLTYQWLHNATDVLPGSDTNSLELADLTLAQAGTYSLMMTNAFGAYTSAPIILGVIPAVERRVVPGIQLSDGLGESWSVEYANNIGPTADWQCFTTLSLNGAVQYGFDTSPQPLPSTRFYRASMTGGFGQAPALQLGFYPALTVPGSIGSLVRIDSIAPIGPTNAWLTLGTTVLTNTTQFYFDVSPQGQTPRLYRVVPIP